VVFKGADDLMVTPDIVADFNAKIDAAGVIYSLVDCPRVLHCFTSPAATAMRKATSMPLAYDEFADQDSYSKTIAALRS